MKNPLAQTRAGKTRTGASTGHKITALHGCCCDPLSQVVATRVFLLSLTVGDRAFPRMKFTGTISLLGGSWVEKDRFSRIRLRPNMKPKEHLSEPRPRPRQPTRTWISNPQDLKSSSESKSPKFQPYTHACTLDFLTSEQRSLRVLDL